MRIPTILGIRYFRDRSRCHIRVRRPQKTPEINFALVYAKLNKNSRRRYTHYPRHQVFSGPEPMSYSCSVTINKPRNNFFSFLYQDE